MKKILLCTFILGIVMSVFAQVKHPSIGGYNVYFGNLHNHTKFSDGRGLIDQAYATAKANGLDFFSVADHDNRLESWEYDSTMRVANRYNEYGVFTTFYGFEWSSGNGHVTVTNAPTFCSSGSPEVNTFGKLMNWISQYDCIAWLNHPGRYNRNDFNRFNDTPNDQVVGIELWNKGDNFSRYYYNDGGYNNDGNLGFWEEALVRGWKIGASGAEDNHGTGWGNDNRSMAVLANNLTRTDIYDAFKNRRFYSTEDKSIVLSFKINGHEMGSTVNSGTNDMQVLAKDKEGEKFTKIELYKNGLLFKTYGINTSSIEIIETIPMADNCFFYVKVTQQDGNEAISSPIFIKGEESTNLPPVCSITAPVNGAEFDEGTIVSITADASDSDGSVANVEFFVNENSIGTDSSAPYAIDWTVGTGNYSLTAVATDNKGVQTISVAVSVTGNTTDIDEQIISGAYYRFTVRHSGKAMNLADSSTPNGSYANQWSLLNNTYQSWLLTDLGDGYWRISPEVNINLALEIEGASVYNEARVLVSEYNGGNNQQWQLVDLGNGYYNIKSRHSGLNLDIFGGSHEDGGTLIQWQPHGGENQQFQITILISELTNLSSSSVAQTSLTLTWDAPSYNIEVAGYDVFMNGSLYITVADVIADITGLTASTTYSFQVTAKDAEGDVIAQSNTIDVTTLDPIVGIYKITARHSGKAMNVADCGTTNGTYVNQWSWIEEACQDWLLTDLENGYYRITPEVNTNLALEIEGASVYNEARVLVSEYNGDNNQQWQLVDLDNGYYNIKARHSGLSLDIYGGSHNDGANFIQWPWHGGENQQFQIIGNNNSKINTMVTSVNESLIKQNQEFRIYPNPMHNRTLNIDLPDYKAGAAMQICNIAGKAVYTAIFKGERNIKLDTDLKNGLYIVKVITNNKTYTEKLIVE